MLRNPLGLRYLFCLLFLWLVHGFVFYGVYHHVYDADTARDHFFKCFASFIFKVQYRSKVGTFKENKKNNFANE